MEPIVKRPVGRPRKTPQAAPAPAKPRGTGLRRAANRAMMAALPAKSYAFPVKPPELMPGVAPAGVAAPVMSMDANPYTFAAQQFPGGGFPGFAYLSQLATRAEFRQMASALATELTREWLEFTSKQDDDTDSAEKIKLIEAEFKRLNVRAAIQTGAEHDCYFGRAQIFLEIAGVDRSTPLILDPRTIKKGSFTRIVPVEAVWTTPAGYNALDPVAPDFYKPSKWFMLGQEVHASRLMTVVSRPLPDILKPAFNFAGMSLSQLAEPYVDNWLRTRQSVSDLLNNFSITALATSMDQVLQGEDDGADLMSRAELFTATRSNKGLMLLDKEREELVQVNTPLSGLHELQAQSQEQMCSVSRMPAIVLTGISPSGLNASSDGEIRIFYDWVAAQQEAHWREPLEVILKAVQLSLFGEIDPDIGFTFTPLYQMTPKEESEIRLSDSQADCAYIAAGVVDPSEVRERLARDPNSGYQSLDTSVELVNPNVAPADGETDPAQDAQFEENKHPRADNGQFGSGGGSAATGSRAVKIGTGSSGDVFRDGNTVTKSATGNEGKVYAALQGVPGVAAGKETGGKITLPFYKNVISVDTLDPKQRAGVAGLVKKNAERIIAAVGALSAAGFSYNDPLQFGLGEGNKMDLLDFSAAQHDAENATSDNLTQLSGFFRTFGQPRIADAISKTSDHFGMQTLEADSRLVDDDDAKLYADMDAKLKGPAKFAYYTLNAREVGLSGIAQTPYDGSQKVILSARPLTDSELQEWEITPVIHSGGAK